MHAAVVAPRRGWRAHHQHSGLGLPPPPQRAHLFVLRLRVRGVGDRPAGLRASGAAAAGAAGYRVQPAASGGAARGVGHGHVRHHGPRLQRAVAADPPDLHADGPDGPSVAVDPHHLVPHLADHVFIQATMTNVR
ncbi:hypothetical protein ON010_g1111 [Phytophthora cinnamomi]|nr:hypothetical protein ON010_g1111 [Phytophthora cinnamomi]